MSKAVVCPNDERFATEISALLQSPPPHQVQEYYEQLLESRKCNGLKVKLDSQFGKGVYAEVNYKEGELLLRDPMLFGSQHLSNKLECLVCSFCFCFIGSIELQIGRRLFFQQLGLSPNHRCHDEMTDSFSSEDVPYERSWSDLNGCASSHKGEIVPLPEEIVNSLMNGEMKLPSSEKFPLPQVVSCPGGCEEAYYCSKSCADADWDASHSLLCTGERSNASSKQALLRFIQHANETNDIFLLAAKAVSYTILRYRKLKVAHCSKQPKHASPHSTEFFDQSLLMEAWKPIAIGHKKRWWECIALPEDIDPADEFAFRKQIKELAFSSLQLLKPAIFDGECEPLFSLEIYGHIIGMFELNNLDLVVASPLEDYFLYIDDLPSPQKEEAEKDTKPILDALGEDHGNFCQGTAFYPLQSCMNHSCCPSAKAFKREEDRDGQATIIALRTICKGEEITISYIDEDLPFEERQALLVDYGFKCSCAKCQEESNS